MRASARPASRPSAAEQLKRFVSTCAKPCLGVNGGDLARIVEGNAASAAVDGVLAQSLEQGQAVSALARTGFVNQLSEEPTHQSTEVDVQARWLKFSEELGKEVREAAERPLPRFCVSEGGVVHRIADCRYTICGWHWSRTQCTMMSEAHPTCRKCSGESLRWGGANNEL